MCQVSWVFKYTHHLNINFQFMAKHQNSLHCYSNTICWKLTSYAKQNYQGLTFFWDQIWGECGQPAGSTISKYKTCHFLLPAGSPMTITEYWHVDVFRPGILSKMWSLGHIGKCTLKLKPPPVSLMRNAQNGCHTTDTLFHEIKSFK